MHPNLDDLLALRDGDGTAEAARHVDQCPRCRAEIEDLRAAASALRSLPTFASEHDHWPEILRQVTGRRRRRFALRAAGVAASVSVLVAVSVLMRAPQPISSPESVSVGAQAAINELAAASQGLEAVLRDPALQRQVLSPKRAAVIVDLEDRIAVLDLALSEQVPDRRIERDVALWSHRVELLDALVTARAGTTGEDGVGYAVLRNEGSQQ